MAQDTSRKARDLLAQFTLLASEDTDLRTWVKYLANAVAFLLARYIDKR